MKKIILILFLSNVVFAREPIKVQLLGINDFHGNLEPPMGSVGEINGIKAGGFEYLATHIKNLRQGHEYSVTVSAGDLFGASPLLSAMFKEEPTIEAMNLLGLDLNAVGNHEFDKGWRQLLKHQEQAQFGFLAANVVINSTQKTLFPGYQIREFGPVKVAFIGVVLEGMEKVSTAQSIEGLSFFDEADTINALIPELEKKGVQTIVVLIHEGGLPTGGFNECPGISGPILDIANRLSEQVGVILSGHTHQAYNCVINNKLVTSAASNGRLVTEIDLVLDPQNGKMLSAQGNNLIVSREVIKDADQTALIKKYKDMAAPIANKIIGHVVKDLSKVKNAAGESMLGKVLADAQLEASALAEVAFVNPGGIRTDLTFASSPANEGDGNVTFSEAFSVLPFGNNLISMNLNGQQIIELLEEQFLGGESSAIPILQISQGFSYTYMKNAPIHHKIKPESIMINGQGLEPLRTYGVVANAFLAEGGDGFSIFKKGTNRQVGVSDIEALTRYLENHSPVLGVEEARVTFLP